MLIAYQDATKTTKAQLAARIAQLDDTIPGMYLTEIHRRSVKCVSLLCVIFQSSHYDFTFLTKRFVIYSLCLLSCFLFLQARLDIIRHHQVLHFVFHARLGHTRTRLEALGAQNVRKGIATVPRMHRTALNGTLL